VSARRLAAAALFALLALQWYWHAWLAPPERAPAWLVASLFSLPLLPPALAFLHQRPKAALWGGIAALGYFCHGIAELQASPGSRVPAGVEVALSLLLVFASSWPGLRARSRRKSAPPPNV
jgi:uncharacterized membrane protein